MNGEQFLKEVRKRQIDIGVTDREIRRVVGWSESTQRRRFKEPDNITLGEAYALENYLNLKLFSQLNERGTT